MKSIYLNIVLFFCLATTLSAQIRLSIADVVAGPPGSPIEVPVTISSDEAVNLLVYQFNLQWNPNQLNFVSLANSTNSTLSTSDFGTIANQEGISQLVSGWEDYPAVLAVNSPTTLFTVTFELAPNVSDEQPIEVNVCSSCPIEFYNESIEAIDLEIEGGTVFLNGVLPLELQSLKAQANPDQTVTLNWVTSEKNSHFNIERSAEGQTWKKIGTVMGRETTATEMAYQFLDTQPLKGINFYRLKVVEEDGKFDYSQVVSAELFAPNAQFSFQNPIENTLIFSYNVPQEENLNLQLYNTTGQLVKQKSWLLSAGWQTRNWNLADLPNGVYFLNVLGKEELTHKIVKH